MKEFIFTSENHLPSAQEVALRVRKMERQQTRMVAKLTADAKTEKKPRRSLLDVLMAIALIFGAPRQF